MSSLLFPLSSHSGESHSHIYWTFIQPLLSHDLLPPIHSEHHLLIQYPNCTSPVGTSSSSISHCVTNVELPLE